jgi:uncharacterized membrane protein
MIRVTLYSKTDCSLCDTALADLQALQTEIPHELAVVDIQTDPALEEAYGARIPVVQVGPYMVDAPFDCNKLRMTLGAARDSHEQQKDDKHYKKRVKRGQQLSGADRFTLWLSRHYLAVLNVFLLLYVGLPFLAPVLMKTGHPRLARPIYLAYGAVCHQLAYRSWFLFGDQPFYPREAANVEGYLSYEEVTGRTAGNTNREIFDARDFTGAELDGAIGYKVAYCERDIAIYGTMFLFGVLYAITGRRIPPLPWFWWMVIGVGPIGLDGGSQLISQFVNLPFLAFRESTPLLRTLTGALFGFTTAWFGFPLLQETFDEARLLVISKIERLKNSGSEQAST